MLAVACSRVNPSFDERGGGGGTGNTDGVETSGGPGVSSAVSATSPDTSEAESGDACSCSAIEECIDGACIPACNEGLQRCEGTCVDLGSDGSNCGDCGYHCDPGKLCAGGECRTDCPAGTQQCGDGCPEIDNPLHCGGCDMPCDPSYTCQDAECKCPIGYSDCDGVCADRTSDPNNCGECGVVCESGTCEGAACYCESGDPCDGVCVDTFNDASNCGGCGVVCEDISQACVGGNCECVPPFTLCGEVCVYTPSDPNYCGDCVTACDGGDLCSGGMCTSTCGAEFTECDGYCVDFDYDPLHCGGCNTTCDPGEVCIQGDCHPYEVPDCVTCPCPQCKGTNCCELPGLTGVVVCTDASGC